MKEKLNVSIPISKHTSYCCSISKLCSVYQNGFRRHVGHSDEVEAGLNEIFWSETHKVFDIGGKLVQIYIL
jgi:hypothetical protein